MSIENFSVVMLGFFCMVTMLIGAVYASRINGRSGAVRLSRDFNENTVVQFAHLQMIRTLLLNFGLLDLNKDNGERILPLANFLVASSLVLQGLYSEAAEVLTNGLSRVKAQQVRFPFYILRAWCFAFTDNRSTSSPNEVVESEVEDIEYRLNRVRMECVSFLNTSPLLEASTAEECVFISEIFFCLALLLIDNVSEAWGVYLRISVQGVGTMHLNLYKRLGGLLWKSNQNIVRSGKVQRPGDVINFQWLNLPPLVAEESLKRGRPFTISLSHVVSDVCGSKNYTATDSAGGARKSSGTKCDHREAELPLSINTKVTILEIIESERCFTLLRNRLFIKSISKLDVDGLVRLIRMGTNPNQVLPDGYALAHYLDKLPTPAGREKLFEVGVNINLESGFGWTPLMTLVNEDRVDLISEYISAGAVIDFETTSSLTAMALASAEGDIEMINALSEQGAILDFETRLGGTPLIFAAIANQVDSVKTLIARGASVNYTSRFGHTALFWASYFGNDAVCHELTTSGANEYLKRRSNNVLTLPFLNSHFKPNQREF